MPEGDKNDHHFSIFCSKVKAEIGIGDFVLASSDTSRRDAPSVHEVVDTDVVLCCLCLLWWKRADEFPFAGLVKEVFKMAVDCWLDEAGVVGICFVFHINHVRKIQYSFVGCCLQYFTQYEVLEDLANLELSEVVDCNDLFLGGNHAHFDSYPC